MRFKPVFCGGALLVMLAICVQAHSRTLLDKKLKYQISIPDNMVIIHTDDAAESGEFFYDSSSNFILQIFKTPSKFKSIGEYLDCTQSQLESSLQKSYGDTSLRLMSCNVSPYYPEKIIMLNMEVSVLPSSFNQAIIYFVHHKKYDVQFSFLFNRSAFEKVFPSISKIMKTLILK
jgi:hypothetical protein